MAASPVQKNAEAENEMGTAPMAPLVIRTALPMMLSLLTNSLYNIVDSIFVSHISEAALTAVSMASPMMLIQAALGNGLAVGLNAAISKALGERDRREVRDIASAAMVMALVCGACVALIGALFAKPFIVWQSGGDQELIHYGVPYLRICMMLCFANLMQWVMDRFIIAVGRPTLFLISLGVASGVNLILDPILIFGFFGLPALGTTGAAIATVTGQFCGAIAGTLVNLKWNHEIPLHFTLRIRARCVMRIMRVGFPTFITQGTVSLMGIFINTVLTGYSTTAVAFYGIHQKVQNFVSIGTFGVTNGMIPIVAYNYGARKPDRIREAIRDSLRFSLLITLVITILLELFPGVILKLFNATDNMMTIGSAGLRIFALVYLVAVINNTMSAIFQALGRGTYSMTVNLSKQIVFVLPLVLLAIQLENLNAIWAMFLVAELLTTIVSLTLYRRTMKAVMKELENSN